MQLKYPIDLVYITQHFGMCSPTYTAAGLPSHNGIDLRTKFPDSPLGRRYVTAAAEGRVLIVRADKTGYGTHIRILHPDSSLTIYGHLTKSYVSVGEMVQTGQRIGLTGSTGTSTAPHLHFEYRLPGWETKPAKQFYGAVDPLNYIS